MAEAVIWAVAEIGAAIGGTVGATLIMYSVEVAYVLIAAAVISSAESQARSARNKARDASNRSQRDRYLMVRSNLEPRKVVLGRSRVSGPLAFIGTYGVDREHMVFTVCLAGHEVDAIEQIYFNDEPVDLDGSGNVIGIRRTENFSISASTATVTLGSDPTTGTVTAKAYYGTTVVTLTVDSVTGRDVSVSGAHAAETGRLEVTFRPDPNPFKPTRYLSANWTGTGTGALQHATLAHTPVAGSVHVVQIGTEGTEEELSAVVTGTDVAFTAQSGVTVKISYQWSPSGVSLARVRKYVGRMDQAADAGMIAALPDVWTSNHRGAGVAYLVVEFDYDREAFSGGEPNISATVRGLKCYDPRKNLSPSPLMEGALVGVPGTPPTGWTVSAAAGLTTRIVSFGTDERTGWPQITIRVNGTATADGNVAVNFAPFSVAPAASPGQQWSARCMVRRISGSSWSVWSTPNFRIVRYDSGGTAALEAQTTITGAMVTRKQDPIEVTEASMDAGTTKVGHRVLLGVSSGQTVDQTFMVLLPQLWQGAIGDSADPYAWSENTALHAINYATHPLGGRLPWDQIDMPWFESEANACDVSTTYTIGDKDFVRPLYRSSYLASTAQQPTDVLTDLCAAMGGEWAYVDGALRICAGAYRTPVLDIDERWLQGNQPVQIQAAAERDSLVNAINGTFIDASQAYRAVPFPEVPQDTPASPNPYADIDGGKLSRDIEYGAIEFEGQAQYVAACQVRKARQGLTVRLKCNMRAWQAQTFDHVTLSLARFGWADKVFQVRKDGFTIDGGVELVLRETGASIWDMDAGFPTVDPEPNTKLPDPWWIPPVENLTADSGNAHLLMQADGTIVSRVWVTWDAVTDPRLLDSTGFIDISWRRMVDDVTEWKTIRVAGSAPGAYIAPAPDLQFILIRAQSIGAVGKSRDTVEIVHQVLGKSALPSNVDNMAAAALPGVIRLSWDACPDLDYDHTELRRGGTNWATATPLYGSGTQPTTAKGTIFDWSWPAQASYTIRAKHFDTSGNESATADTLALTVTDTILVGTDELEEDAATDVSYYADPNTYSKGSSSTDISELAFTTVVANQRVIATIQFLAEVGGAGANGAIGHTGADNGFLNRLFLETSGGTLVDTGASSTFTQTDLTSYTLRGDFVITTPGSYKIVLRANGQTGASVTRDYQSVRFSIEGIKR